MISQIGSVLGIIIVVAFGLYVLLGFVIFFTHLIEKRPVRYLKPAEADDPEHARLSYEAAAKMATLTDDDNPYASPGAIDYATVQNAGLAALGYTSHGLFVSKKGGTYNYHTALWMSPDRRTLAVVVWGTLAKIKIDKTRLYTQLADGTCLITCDKIPGIDTPGFYELHVLQNCTLDQLVARHDHWVAASGKGAVPFDGPDGLANYESILVRREEFLVNRKDDYYLDPEKSVVRSTVKGAAKAYLRSLRVPSYIEKMPEQGDAPVPAVKGGVSSGPPRLAVAQRAILFCWMFGFVYAYYNPTKTLAQILFRALFIVVVLTAQFALWGVKLALKKTAPSP
jgi:hypothetical protein